MDFSSRHLLVRAADRAQHASVREAAAKDARHSFLDFFFSCLGMLVEKSFSGENYAVQAKAALGSLLFNESFLYRMRLVDRAQPFQRDDLKALNRFHRRDAGAHRLALHKDRAGSALAEATAEFRAAQAEVIAQHVQQRRGWIDVQAVSLSVYLQR